MKLLYLLLFTTLLNGCVGKNEMKLSTEINPENFQKIIKEIYLINAHVYNNKYSKIKLDTINLQIIQVLKENNFNSEDLSNAIKYYSSNPRILDSLIIDLRDSLQNEQLKFKNK